MARRKLKKVAGKLYFRRLKPKAAVRYGRRKRRRATSDKQGRRWIRHARRQPALPKPLSILYIVHAFYPDSYTGTEKFVLNMAKSMQGRGHRVKVATYSTAAEQPYPNSLGDIVFREYDYDGLPVLAYRHLTEDPAWRFEVGNNDLALFAEEILDKEKPDLVHFGHPMRAMEFMQVCAGRGIPYIVTLTDFWTICPKGIMLRTDGTLCDGPAMGDNCQTHCQIPNVRLRMDRYVPLLRSAARIVSPSAALAGLFKHSLPELNVEVLHHGMNPDVVAVNERTYGPGDPIALFYGGSLNPHKGVHLILQAMAAIPSDRLSLKIYGTGAPDYTESLRQAAVSDSRVSMCGSYSEQDIRHIYQSVDVAVVPSVWYENYPLALHEALASHVPALVSDVGGMAEKVADGFNGFTFRVGDAGHLAERIQELLDHPELLNGFKANMRQVQFPSIAQEADAYENMYRVLVPAGSGPPARPLRRKPGRKLRRRFAGRTIRTKRTGRSIGLNRRMRKNRKWRPARFLRSGRSVRRARMK